MWDVTLFGAGRVMSWIFHRKGDCAVADMAVMSVANATATRSDLFAFIDSALLDEILTVSTQVTPTVSRLAQGHEIARVIRWAGRGVQSDF